MKKVIVILIILFAGLGLFYFLGDKNQKENFDNQILNSADKKENQKSFDNKTISGRWMSLDDEKFIREFSEDLTFKDIYEGEVIVGGVWYVFDSNNTPSEFIYPVESGKNYLVMNDTSASLSFMINELTKDKLVLFYLDSGAVLEFKKI